MDALRLQTGLLCYYATSEVLMLRSLGIPARMAVGFSQGNPLTAQGGPTERERAILNTFVVLRSNAHAWPEVYFPEIGWIEFEPTAGQAPLDRPLPPQDPANANNPNPLSKLLTEDNRDFAGREQIDAGVTAPVEPGVRTLPTL